MKTFFLTATFVFYTLIAFAQKTVDAIYLARNKDTIRCKMVVRTNLFNTKLIEDVSSQNKISFIDGKSKSSVRRKDILYLEFTDYLGRKRTYVPKGAIEGETDDGILYEQVVKGKLSWYRRYNYNILNGTTAAVDYIFFAGEKMESNGLFEGVKGRLRDLLGAQRPDLLPLIENVKGASVYQPNETAIEIMKQYNAK